MAKNQYIQTELSTLQLSTTDYMINYEEYFTKQFQNEEGLSKKEQQRYFSENMQHNQIFEILQEQKQQNQNHLLAQRFQFDFYCQNQLQISNHFKENSHQQLNSNLHFKIPLYIIQTPRPILYIQVNSTVQNQYCTQSRGRKTDTRHLHEHIRTINKRYFKKKLKEDDFHQLYEQQIISDYMKSNASFQSTQNLFGIQKKQLNQATVQIKISNKSDNIRKQMLQYYSGSRIVQDICNGNVSLKERLLMIKFLEKFRRGIINPQKYSRWKENEN